MNALAGWLRAEIARAPALYAAAALVFASFLAYANSLDGGFHFDDTHHIVANPFLRTLDYAGDYFTRPDMFSALPGHDMYRPVLLLTFALNYQWGGYDPLPWRLTAIALHAFVAVGVFLTIRILWRELQERSPGTGTGVGFVAALVFAVHPVFTESVNYASARSSLLAAGLVLWALLCHRWAAQARRAAVRLALWSLSLALFCLGLLSKEIAIVYPALLLWLAWQEHKGFRAVLPSLLLAVLYLALRSELLGHAVMDFSAHEAAARSAPDPATGGARPVLWNLYTQARVIPAYLLLFVKPVGLCVDRFVRVSETLWEPVVIGGGLLIAALLYAAWRVRRTHPLVSFGLIWFFVALAPTSSIIPLNVVMNEHRLYLPGIGLAIVCAGLAAVWWRSSTWSRGALVGVTFVFLVLTLARNPDWRDSHRLWESTVAVSPDSHGAWNSLGVQRGFLGEFESACDAYREAYELNPRSWQATFNLGTIHLGRGRRTENEADLHEAERWLLRSLEIESRSQRSRWFLAEVRWHLGRRDEARAAFNELASESPRLFEMTRPPLARMAIEEEDYEQAANCYDYLLRFGNDPVAAHLGLARIADARGKLREMDRQVRLAMEARPHDPQPHLFLAREHAGSGRAVRHLVDAERRGYRVSAMEREEILSGRP